MAETLAFTDRPAQGRALVGLGTNVAFRALAGPRLLAAALTALTQAGLTVEEVSRFWTSPAWPDPTDPPFVNAAARLAVGARNPDEIYAIFQAVEARFGRVRLGRNAPRTLDLDLLDLDGLVVAPTPVSGVQLPHPRLRQRAFVLGPLCDIDPNWRWPNSETTAASLFAALGAHAAAPLPME